MIRSVAIVEDNKDASELLADYLERFSVEHGCEFKTTFFYNSSDYLENCRLGFDIVFMDIELPDGNGMEAVRKIREQDVNSLVIFVTNLAKYAVQGYAVKAFDFIVKPVQYPNFELKLLSALECLDKSNEKEFWINIKEGRILLKSSSITYVEVIKHYLTFHTLEGNYVTLGSISSVAEMLKDCRSFAFCNRCYLVNLKYVTQIKQLCVTVNGEALQISRQKRANFLKAVNDYFGGGCE